MAHDKRIIVISCGKQKLARPASARELYIGPYFRALLGYALTIASPEEVYILSAKYGLVQLEDQLEPYELKMGTSGSVEDKTVSRQAKQFGVEGHKVIALAGSRYIKLIRKVWASVETPLEGKGGLFRQISWLKRQVELRSAERTSSAVP